jgi:dTDP-4-dehydrorhamnose 3,5-epimerase
MRFHETELPGVLVVEPEVHRDERGSFARAWCREEFCSRGLVPDFVQANTAVNRVKGTVRGLHYQVDPHTEAKLIRCTRGAIYDVAVDVRTDSPTYGRWAGVELSSESGRMFYVPPGCAHGYQTLADDTEVFYLVSAFYCPGAERGVRHDDPAVGISWPLPVSLLSEKDRAWPALEYHGH